MILQNISIINYKNIKAANLELSPKINCLIGHNGVGKTNFLDAIYYLSFCRSAYNPIDSQVIAHDENFMVIEGNYLLRYEAWNEEALQAQQEGVQTTVTTYRIDTAHLCLSF